MTDIVPTIAPTRTLRSTIAEQIAGISSAVNDRVVSALVEAEAQKRADTIVKGLDKLQTREREGYQLAKGDVVTYNEDGTVATQTFTQDRLKARKENNEKMDKLVRALDKAIDKGDMSDLYKIVN